MKKFIVPALFALCTSFSYASEIRELGTCSLTAAGPDHDLGVSITSRDGKLTAEVTQTTIAGVSTLGYFAVNYVAPVVSRPGSGAQYIGKDFALNIVTTAAPRTDGKLPSSLKAKKPTNQVIQANLICDRRLANPTQEKVINLDLNSSKEMYQLLVDLKAKPLPVMDASIYEVSDVSCSYSATPRNISCELKDHDGSELTANAKQAQQMMNILRTSGVPYQMFVDASAVTVKGIGCNEGTFIGHPTGTVCSVTVK